MESLPESLQTILANNPTLHSTLTSASSWLSLSPSTTLTQTTSALRKSYIQPYIITPLSHVLASGSGSGSGGGMPDLVTILLLAIILLISLKILDYARRVVVFWVRLVLRVVFWVGVVLAGVAVWRGGVQGVLEWVGWVWGVVLGLGSWVERLSSERAGNAGGSGSWGSAGSGRYGYGYAGGRVG